MLERLKELKSALEYLGGVINQPPAIVPRWMQGPLWWGFWWAVLVLLMLAFSGQTSKFIYIDF